MTLKVVKFSRERTDSFAPKVLLKEALEQDLEVVIILGDGPAGSHTAYSTADVAAMLLMIEVFKLELLMGGFDSEG